ncbi:S-adenosylmethionine decarboxylase [Candidatus Babeliales bacterium]|nr:S-adenosylmethionine decarboxylase [Candidatus Babeliales bacterium]
MKKLCLALIMTVGFINVHAAVRCDSYETIQEAYDQGEVWGVLTSIDLHDCNPETIRSADAIRDYVVQLCELIEMRRFGECQVVHFGDDEKVSGFSMTQLIETSLISGHFANFTNTAYIDVFSCKLYDPTLVIDFTKKFFEAADATANIALRN